MRTAIEALAAVLGGTQSLHTNSFDEALALPTEDAVRLALRTQQVIAHETGVVNTIDPLGGSYYVEQLTNELEAQAYEYFERIEELGGMVEAIKQNFSRARSPRLVPYQAEVDRGSASSSASTATSSTTSAARLLKSTPRSRAAGRPRAVVGRRRDSAEVERRLAALKEARRRATST